jgi:hypothetical protein
MSTLATANLKNPSSGSNNIVLNTDGTIGGAALAGVSDVTGINTTGSVTSGATSLTVASATGIAAGMYVVGEGITPGTTVSTVVGTTVTLSANAGATLSSDPVTFYSASKIITPAAVGGMLCRAWVNFNGTSTVAIRASYNVSSITDNGTGDYTVNFTTALADANYAVNAVCSPIYAGNRSASVISAVNSSTVAEVAPTTSAIRIGTVTSSTAVAFDSTYVNVSIFR